MDERYTWEHTRPERAMARRPAPSWLTMVGIWVLVFLLIWTAVKPSRSQPLHDPGFEARAVTPRGDLTGEEQDTIEVFREASPSVCYITNIEHGRSWFNMDITEIPQGSGSGFVYDKQGHIVTNYHVILRADDLRVTLADHSEWRAEFVGGDPDKDIAVLRIDAPAERLKPIPLGSSSDLQVGQKVLAIGNPFGFDQTLTVGVISALGREIRSLTGRKIRDVIQTDAAINPGNSGGPLLDSAGRVIGVNTQIASPSGASAGIGFAVPVDIVHELVPDLIRYGHVRRPGLGVRLVEDRITKSLGLPGVLVESVFENGPADQAGIRGTTVDRRGRVRQLGDIIVQIGETKINSINELKDELERYKAKDEVEVYYIRDDSLKSTTVMLRELGQGE